MSKRKTRKEKIKSQQRLEFNRIEIKRLEEDLIIIEHKINDYENKKIKNACLKNLKIFGSVCNFIMPFVITSGITVSGLNFLGFGLPFIKDNIRKEKRYTLDYETNGNIESEEHYSMNNIFGPTLSDNELTIYSPWTLTEDNLYERTIKTFDINYNTSSVSLYNAILNKDIERIEEIYPNYTLETETTNQISSINDDYIIDAYLDFLDSNDILTYKENSSANNFVTFFELLVCLGIPSFISYRRSFSLIDSIKNINKKYESQKEELRDLYEQLDQKQKRITNLSNGGKTYARRR